MMKHKLKKASYLAGKVKVWQMRLASYVAIVNFVMIFYLYILESPMGFEWYHWLVLIVGGIIVIVFIDTKFILPSSQVYTFNKNPEFVKLKEQVHKNKVMLDAIMKHFDIKKR